jgi:dTDP-4-amino-4,6-dideoxygalactose transaminase
MSLQPAYRGDDPRFPDISGSYPVSVDLWNTGLYLPSGLPLTEEQIVTVANRVKELKP